MSDLLEKCSVCRALIDEEDLFCANCGAEAPHQDLVAPTSSESIKHHFGCGGCGASMSYDASAQTLRCPFCGSQDLDAGQSEQKSLAPRRIVAFHIDRESAVHALRKWLGRGFWRPSDLSNNAALAKIAPVYVPYWVFTARTFSYWTADTNQTPWGARGDWFPMSGEHRGNYDGMLIGASGALTPSETAAICPFDLSAAVAPEEIDLDNYVVEQFRVQRKYARPLARQGLAELERQACQQYVPGRSRNVKVNMRLEGLTSEPVLLPVWIMAYRYQDRMFRFLLNGQTGRASGQAPTSWKKVLVALAVVFGFVVGLGLLVGVISVLAN